jgi:alpha-beta hydrolase superfamily lysophospholipase
MKDRKWLRLVSICFGSLVVLYFSTAFVLINCPEPTFSTTSVFSISDAAAEGILTMLRQDYEYQEHRFAARDGTDLFARHYAAESDLTVLLLHGVTASSYLFDTTCGLIRQALGAEVFALDLRGHGESDGTRGDIAYIGQYEDDVADVLAAIRTQRPTAKLILAGHSMGGGIVLRYAQKKGPSEVDGYLLFAPHLGFNSPTAYSSQSAGDGTGEPWFKVHLMRLVGLFMLNSVGIDGFNELPISFFNYAASDSPRSPVGRYTYRAFSSVAPADYRRALAAVDRPLLVLVGANDEPFSAEHFEPVVSENSEGEVILFEGLDHNSIIYDDETIAAAGKWMKEI